METQQNSQPEVQVRQSDGNPDSKATKPASANGSEAGLLSGDALSGFQSRWQTVQTGFVDDPRAAVRDAEGLVNDMVQRLTDVFTQERKSLEEVWSRGDEASTEDLRVALQRYRSFFERLLAA